MAMQLRATAHRRKPLPVDEFVKLLLEQAQASNKAARRTRKTDEGERGAA